MLKMHATSQTVPNAKPASTSLAKCTRKNTRLLAVVNAMTVAAMTVGKRQPSGKTRTSTYAMMPYVTRDPDEWPLGKLHPLAVAID